jgi:hypothetical protein
METTTYVRNIFKYYVAYRMTLEAQEPRARRAEMESAARSRSGRSPRCALLLARLLDDLPGLVGIELRVLLRAAFGCRDRGPFRITTPSWFTMNVITPEFP